MPDTTEIVLLAVIGVLLLAYLATWPVQWWVERRRGRALGQAIESERRLAVAAEAFETPDDLVGDGSGVALRPVPEELYAADAQPLICAETAPSPQPARPYAMGGWVNVGGTAVHRACSEARRDGRPICPHCAPILVVGPVGQSS